MYRNKGDKPLAFILVMFITTMSLIPEDCEFKDSLHSETLSPELKKKKTKNRSYGRGD
jgi:hypothetical protein